jgi:hypothetical protein
LEHAPSIVGLPSAALAALGLVLLLRTVDGRIEAKFFGLEFRGYATIVDFDSHGEGSQTQFLAKE